MKKTIFYKGIESRNKVEHLVLAAKIKRLIQTGEFNSEQTILTEKFVSKHFNTSLFVAKKSLATLINEGVIYSIPGRKTYVACVNDLKPYELYFDEALSFDNEHEEMKITEINFIKSDYEISSKLRIPYNSYVVMIKRIFTQYDEKIKSYDEQYIPYKRGEPIFERLSGLTAFPDPELIATKSRVLPVKKELTIKSISATNEICQIFGIPENDAILLVEHKKISTKNQPIEFSRRYIPGNSSNLKASIDILL